MKTILLILLTIIATSSIAQKDIIVLTNLDTIHCDISKVNEEVIAYKLNESNLTIESKSVYYVLTDTMKRPRYFNEIDAVGKDKIAQKQNEDADVIMNTSLVRIMCTLKVPTDTHIIYSRGGKLDSLHISEVYVVMGRNMTSAKYYNTEGHGKIDSELLRGQTVIPSNRTAVNFGVRSWESIAGSRLEASGAFMLVSIALSLATVLSAAKPYSNELITGLGVSSGVCVVISSTFLISAGQALKKK